MTTSVKPMLDAKLVNAIMEATSDVLTTMAATQVQLKELQPQVDYKPTGDISSVMGLSGENGEGMIALSFSLSLANKLVSRLLGVGEHSLSGEDRVDGIGELVNMISGRAKIAISDNGADPYRLTLPSIILGANHEVASRPKNAPYLVLLFDVEGDTFAVQVAFKQR